MSTEQEINFLKRDDPVDLGLNTSDIKATRQTLQRLKQHPNYPSGYDVALKQVLDEQDRVASFRETERQLKGAQIVTTRRNFTKLMLKFAGLSVVAGGGLAVFSAINQSCFSPEAIARRDEEFRINQEANRQNQEKEKQDKIRVENAARLGLTPSAISVKGFRIRYNPVERNVRYVEVGGKYGYFTLGKGSFIEWQEEKAGQEKLETVKIESYVLIDSYTRVQDGIKIPKLVVRVKSSSATIDNPWYLRDQPTDEIDNSVVVFENVDNKREHIFAISTPDDFNTYQFRLMKKEPVARPR